MPVVPGCWAYGPCRQAIHWDSKESLANFHAGNELAPLIPKGATGVPSRWAKIAKTFDDERPRELTRRAATPSYPGLLGTE